jgi:hypothetical protein
MSTRSKTPKPQTRIENQDFSVEGVLSQEKSSSKDLIEIVAKACIDSSKEGSSQTLAGLNAANEEKREYKNLLLYACIALWVICMFASLFILYFPSTSVTDDMRKLAATAAIQTLPSLAFGFLVGKSTE